LKALLSIPFPKSAGAALFEWHTPTLAFFRQAKGYRDITVPSLPGFSRASRSSGFIQSLPPKRSHTQQRRIPADAGPPHCPQGLAFGALQRATRGCLKKPKINIKP